VPQGFDNPSAKSQHLLRNWLRPAILSERPSSYHDPEGLGQGWKGNIAALPIDLEGRLI